MGSKLRHQHGRRVVCTAGGAGWRALRWSSLFPTRRERRMMLVIVLLACVGVLLPTHRHLPRAVGQDARALALAARNCPDGCEPGSRAPASGGKQAKTHCPVCDLAKSFSVTALPSVAVAPLQPGLSLVQTPPAAAHTLRLILWFYGRAPPAAAQPPDSLGVRGTA